LLLLFTVVLGALKLKRPKASPRLVYKEQQHYHKHDGSGFSLASFAVGGSLLKKHILVEWRTLQTT